MIEKGNGWLMVTSIGQAAGVEEERIQLGGVWKGNHGEAYAKSISAHNSWLKIWGVKMNI
ncbi:hypothetical protein AALA79_20525 [Lachnospiraceae bacterium 64-25]